MTPIEKPHRTMSRTSRTEQRLEVGGEGVVVVADRGLAGLAEAAPVVWDHAEAGGEQDAASWRSHECPSSG